nr:hypothetical protein NCPCFENI_01167 [Cupriavidus sp.]
MPANIGEQRDVAIFAMDKHPAVVLMCNGGEAAGFGHHQAMTHIARALAKAG